MSNDELDERVFVDFTQNDFIIRISPILDDDDEWTGELNVGYLTLDENYMNEEDYAHVDMVANMVVSSIPLMEDDLAFRNKLYKYTQDAINSSVKTARVEPDEDDKVIKLRFN